MDNRTSTIFRSRFGRMAALVITLVTVAVAATGEPDDAVLNKYLEPGQEYDVWLEGTNDGSDWFSWRVGRGEADLVIRTTDGALVQTGCAAPKTETPARSSLHPERQASP